MFDKVMQETRCNHTPHECRHTCATMLDNANANETATKRILGHSVQGITKGVYTHKDLHQLKKAIDLLRWIYGYHLALIRHYSFIVKSLEMALRLRFRWH